MLMSVRTYFTYILTDLRDVRILISLPELVLYNLRFRLFSSNIIYRNSKSIFENGQRRYYKQLLD